MMDMQVGIVLAFLCIGILMHYPVQRTLEILGLITVWLASSLTREWTLIPTVLIPITWNLWLIYHIQPILKNIKFKVKPQWLLFRQLLRNLGYFLCHHLVTLFINYDPSVVLPKSRKWRRYNIYKICHSSSLHPSNSIPRKTKEPGDSSESGLSSSSATP